MSHWYIVCVVRFTVIGHYNVIICSQFAVHFVTLKKVMQYLCDYFMTVSVLSLTYSISNTVQYTVAKA